MNESNIVVEVERHAHQCRVRELARERELARRRRTDQPEGVAGEMTNRWLAHAAATRTS
jgi:hypothetical protein